MYLAARDRISATLLIVLISFCSLFLPKQSFSQTNEFNSANPVLLTSSTSCTIPTNGNPTYTLDGSTDNAAVPAGCSIGTHYDVWFYFIAGSTSETVTIGHFGNNITNPEVQIFSGTAYANFVSEACGSTSATANSLTVGATYYIRVSNVGASPSGSGQTAKFDICLTHPTPPPTPPSNDDCSTATNLTVGTTNNSGTVWAATASSSISTGCASGTPDDDVWYKFTATSSNINIALSGLGSNIYSAGAMLQLFSGSCGSLVSVACGYNSLSASITSGNVYYVRVYSSASGSIGGIASGSAFSITVSNASTPSSTTLTGSRMNEVFKLTTISSSGNLNYPWEITYGPDGYLWITESRGYRVVRMDPNTGLKNTVLDISQNSPFLPSYQSFNLQFDFAGQGNPQGGCAGLALHPLFLDPVTPKNYVYVSYIHTYNSTAANSGGVFFTNRIVRFEYNTTTGFLQNPISLCDTLPGSSDHNSQRMIIAPVGGTFYLFYASGDMGGGQYSNLNRPIKSQDQNSYEGKILRFNLEPVSGSWIPADNPFGSNSAVWSTGVRNNQGFAYTTINGTGYLYGSSHGPYSDDEINIIEKGKNYGHPLVIGYSTDGNYDGAAAGPSNGSAPAITSESDNAAAIGLSYKDPIFTFYPAPKGNTTTSGTIQNMWSSNPPNSGWPSEAPSGLEVYTNTLIPGWKNSLVSSALKWGRLVRLKLNNAGTGIQPINGQDTATYFDNPNRYRDLTISPNGKDIYIVMDNNSATSGPGTNNPSIVSCAGCVHKYTFLGYNHNSSTNRSTIPNAIDITGGTTNAVSVGTTVTIDASNNNLWVPITGPDGNIMAEIKANGNNLGTITSSFYTAGTLREDANKRLYLNRSITITPQNQPASSVSVRFYITSSELSALVGASNSQGAGSGVSNVSSLKILKNDDANSIALTATTSTITPTYAEAFGSNGFVLQADITSFSSFYFGNPNFGTLPVSSLTFSGSLEDNGSSILKWETTNETNTSYFVVEKSVDGNNYTKIGNVNASGGVDVKTGYSFIDLNAGLEKSAVVYYRLKVFDQDGKYAYSKIISMVLNKNLNVLLFPNPVKQILNIRLSGTDRNPIFVQVMDLGGRVIHSEKTAVSQNSSISIDVKHWKSQVYILKVINSRNEVISTQKFEKL